MNQSGLRCPTQNAPPEAEAAAPTAKRPRVPYAHERRGPRFALLLVHKRFSLVTRTMGRLHKQKDLPMLWRENCV